MSYDQDRKKRALALGLPEDASWDDICRHNNEIDRKKRALALGLPEDASWDDICKSH